MSGFSGTWGGGTHTASCVAHPQRTPAPRTSSSPRPRDAVFSRPPGTGAGVPGPVVGSGEAVSRRGRALLSWGRAGHDCALLLGVQGPVPATNVSATPQQSGQGVRGRRGWRLPRAAGVRGSPGRGAGEGRVAARGAPGRPSVRARACVLAAETRHLPLAEVRAPGASQWPESGRRCAWVCPQRRRQQQVFLGRGPGSSTSPAGPSCRRRAAPGEISSLDKHWATVAPACVRRGGAAVPWHER